MATVTRRDAKRALATLCGRVKCCGTVQQVAAHTATAAAAVGITKTTIQMNSVNDAFCNWQLQKGREHGMGKEREGEGNGEEQGEGQGGR